MILVEEPRYEKKIKRTRRRATPLEACRMNELGISFIWAEPSPITRDPSLSWHLCFFIKRVEYCRGSLVFYTCMTCGPRGV